MARLRQAWNSCTDSRINGRRLSLYRGYRNLSPAIVGSEFLHEIAAGQMARGPPSTVAQVVVSALLERECSQILYRHTALPSPSGN